MHILDDNAVAVYVSAFPFPCDGNIFCAQRKAYIESAKTDEIKAERFYVWKLLERAVTEQLGLDFSAVEFEQENGVFFTSEFHFSLSHSNGVCAVAVSKKNAVGADVEKIEEKRWQNPRFSSILSPLEKTAFPTPSPAFLNALFTKKESVYKKAWKRGDKTPFVPQKVCTVNAKTVTKAVFCKNEKFFLSVCSDVENYAFFALENTEIKDVNL